MNKKTVVIFDIDYTLFNTKTFRTNLYGLLAKKLGQKDLIVFFDLAKQTEQETKKAAGYFKPRVFIKLLHKKMKAKVPLTELENIFFDETLYVESLYDDTRDVFQELVMKRNIDIIIFSTGEKEFQMQKLEVLKEMLTEDQIHIFINKLTRLKDILLQYTHNHVYLVDDVPTVLQQAKEFDADITTVWINRDKQIKERGVIEKFKIDKVIRKLDELPKLIPFHQASQ